jgi:hypothetical protein
MHYQLPATLHPNNVVDADKCDPSFSKRIETECAARTGFFAPEEDALFIARSYAAEHNIPVIYESHAK